MPVWDWEESEINRFEAEDIHTVAREMIIYITVDTVDNSACLLFLGKK